MLSTAEPVNALFDNKGLAAIVENFSVLGRASSLQYGAVSAAATDKLLTRRWHLSRVNSFQ